MPLLTLGPPGWSSAGGDARRDECPGSLFRVPTPRHGQDLSTARLWSRHSCDVSSDRHSGGGPVFLALGYWTHFPG